MSAGTWQCKSCHKNNVAGAANCSVCLRKRGVVAQNTEAKHQVPTKPSPMTGEERARVLGADRQQRSSSQVRPKPGRVRTSGGTPATGRRTPLEEPTLSAPEFPRISTAPPPGRLGAPYAPLAPARPRRGGRWLVKTGLWSAAILLGWQFVLPWAQEVVTRNSSGATDDDGRPPVSAPCPPEVAAVLPGQAATLVARYQTSKHVITLCLTNDGQTFYNGQVKGRPPGPDTRISLLAQSTGDGYIAHNGTYTYQITGGRVVVTNAGRTLLDEVLQPA